MKKVIYVRPELDVVVMSVTDTILASGGGTLGDFDDDTNNPIKEGSLGELFDKL